MFLQLAESPAQLLTNPIPDEYLMVIANTIKQARFKQFIKI
jgi:hypothetical protein